MSGPRVLIVHWTDNHSDFWVGDCHYYYPTCSNCGSSSHKKFVCACRRHFCEGCDHMTIVLVRGREYLGEKNRYYEQRCLKHAPNGDMGAPQNKARFDYEMTDYDICIS